MKILRFLYILLILIIPLGEFSRFPLGSSGISVYFNDGLLAVAFILLLFEIFVMKRKFKLPPLFLPILIFILLAFTTLIFAKQNVSGTEFIVSSLYLVRWILYAGIYFGLYFIIRQIDNLEERELEVRYFTKIVIFSGFLLALLGLIQFMVFPDFSALVDTGWDPHYYRVLSTFFDPNYVGGFFVLNLNLILALFYSDKLSRKNWFYFVITGVIFIATILTFSRSTYVALIASFGIFGLIKSRKLLLAGFLSLILVFFLVPKVQERVYGAVVSVDGSASARFTSWARGWEIAKDNLITGVGYNTYRYAQVRYGFLNSWDKNVGGHSGSGVDSSLLLIFATTGIFGFLSYVFIYVVTVSRSISSYIQYREGLAKSLNLALLCAVIGLLFHSIFVNSLLYTWVMEWVWIVLALRDGLHTDLKQPI